MERRKGAGGEEKKEKKIADKKKSAAKKRPKKNRSTKDRRDNTTPQCPRPSVHTPLPRQESIIGARNVRHLRRLQDRPVLADHASSSMQAPPQW